VAWTLGIESNCISNPCKIWKSGKTKSGQGVPWNIQLVNTNAQNFLWEKDKVNIVVIAPGLYEITFGFFCKKKNEATVQILINGLPVMTGVHSAQSYPINGSLCLRWHICT
jgi:hypothetical protein